jgi:hypothetical protein
LKKVCACPAHLCLWPLCLRARRTPSAPHCTRTTSCLSARRTRSCSTPPAVTRASTSSSSMERTRCHSTSRSQPSSQHEPAHTHAAAAVVLAAWTDSIARLAVSDCCVAWPSSEVFTSNSRTLRPFEVSTAHITTACTRCTLHSSSLVCCNCHFAQTRPLAVTCFRTYKRCCV